ncbi:MAG: LacI family DNA-binding transcriptional regulator [Halothermotrichaceae bacterium]
MVTIKDIAKEAGVSSTTVSRVINQHTYVNGKTREKVIKVIDKYNYRPSAIARGLSTNKSYTIGLLGSTQFNLESTSKFSLNDPFLREVIFGIESNLGEKDYDILYFTAKKNNLSYKDICEHRKIDGVIFLGYVENTPDIKELVHSGIPTVFIGSNITAENAASVMSDNLNGAKKALKYLVDMGHKDIGFIMGSKNILATRHRLEGYMEMLKKNNLRINKEWILYGTYTKRFGYKAMKKIISLTDRPTTIFCQDEIAIGAYKAVKEAGYDIPGDFSFVGFDDLEMSEYVFPQLTTIRQHKYKIGKIASELLLNIISEEKNKEKHIILPTELVKRKSCEDYSSKI